MTSTIPLSTLTPRMPEELPVAAARAGDKEAWNRLFKRYQLPLYTFVYELVRHEQTALDLVQESFINAARHLGNLRQDGKFGSWLFGIAHQKCVQHWRKNRVKYCAVEEMDELADDLADPAEMLISKEQEEQFMNLLQQLPEPQRAVVLLYFIEEFSLAEIAEATHVPVGTVKSRLHYARQTLRHALTQSTK